MPSGKLPMTDEEFNHRVESMFSVQKHMEGRLAALEDRVLAIETLAARVPGIEARISRVERLMLEVQGEVRRMIRSFTDSHKLALDYYGRIETKVDRLITFLDKAEASTPAPALPASSVIAL